MLHRACIHVFERSHGMPFVCRRPCNVLMLRAVCVVLRPPRTVLTLTVVETPTRCVDAVFTGVQTPMRRTVDELMRTSMGADTKSNVEKLAMELMEKEMKECTFKPAVNRNPKYYRASQVRGLWAMG